MQIASGRERRHIVGLAGLALAPPPSPRTGPSLWFEYVDESPARSGWLLPKVVERIRAALLRVNRACSASPYLMRIGENYSQ